VSDKTFFYVENRNTLGSVWCIFEYLHRPPKILSIQAGTLASCVSHLDVIFNYYVQRTVCVLRVDVSAKRRLPVSPTARRGRPRACCWYSWRWGTMGRKQHRSRRVLPAGFLLKIELERGFFNWFHRFRKAMNSDENRFYATFTISMNIIFLTNVNSFRRWKCMLLKNVFINSRDQSTTSLFSFL